MNEPTPFERLRADNDDLRARLQLADERAFEQAAEIARLRSGNDGLLRSLRNALTWLEAFKQREGIADDGPMAYTIAEINRALYPKRD